MRGALWFRALLGTATLAMAAACTDAPVAPTARTTAQSDVSAPNTGDWFDHYVAMGTSISEGWASDGVIAGTQYYSWPAQLTRKAGRELTQPYIDVPGCRSPWGVPLVGFKRISGEGLGTSPSLSCAPNRSDVTLPTGNVAITGARVWQAYTWTPQTIPVNDNNARHMTRVLPPNMTQVTAMQVQNPKLVSVEFGGNEVLGANSGLVLIPQVVEDPRVYARQYDELLGRVKLANPQGVVLVGVPADLTSIPGFRLGSELWAERLTFLGGFNVDVQANCNGSTNLITVPALVLQTVGAGLQAKQVGLGPVPLSCADRPGQVDYILTQADVRFLREVLGKMATHVKLRARQNNWAYFDLSSAYANPSIKPPFSVVALMTSLEPFGPYFSADGFHTSAAGQALLANAAAAALNARYNLGLTATVTMTANPFLSR